MCKQVLLPFWHNDFRSLELLSFGSFGSRVKGRSTVLPETLSPLFNYCISYKSSYINHVNRGQELFLKGALMSKNLAIIAILVVLSCSPASHRPPYKVTVYNFGAIQGITAGIGQDIKSIGYYSSQPFGNFFEGSYMFGVCAALESKGAWAYAYPIYISKDVQIDIYGPDSVNIH